MPEVFADTLYSTILIMSGALPSMRLTPTELAVCMLGPGAKPEYTEIGPRYEIHPKPNGRVQILIRKSLTFIERECAVGEALAHYVLVQGGFTYDNRVIIQTGHMLMSDTTLYGNRRKSEPRLRASNQSGFRHVKKSG